MQGSRTNLFINNSFLKFSLIKQTRNVVFMTGISFALVACGGGGGGPVPAAQEKKGTVSGSAYIGLIESGDITVYEFKSAIRGAVITKSPAGIEFDPKTFLTTYNVELQIPSQPIMVCLNKASYTEVSKSKRVFFDKEGTQELCAVDNYISGSSLEVTLTFYSHVATGLANYLMTQGDSAADAVSKANQEIGYWVDINVNRDRPLDITFTATNTPASLVGFHRSGFANAAISAYSGWVNGVAGLSPTNNKRFETYNSILFAQRAYTDIMSDGLLDGQSNDGPVGMGPVPVSTKTYRHDLALDILVMANHPRNNSKITLSDQNELSISLFSFAESFSFFDHPDSVLPSLSEQKIFGSSIEGAILKDTAPVLNNFIVPKIISGDVVFASSLTDIKDQAVSVEYRLVAPATAGNTAINDPIDIFVKNTNPVVTLDRTKANFINPITSANGVTPVTYKYPDRDDYELHIQVSFNDGTKIVTLPTVKKIFSIRNNGTLIVGPNAVSKSNTVNGLFNLVASVTNTAGINSIALEIDGNLSTIPVTNFTSGGTNNVPIYRIDSTTLANGLHTFVIIATDTVPLESRSAPLSLTVAN